MILYPTIYTHNNPLQLSPGDICAYLGQALVGGSAGGPSPVSRSRRIEINTPIEDSYCALPYYLHVHTRSLSCAYLGLWFCMTLALISHNPFPDLKEFSFGMGEHCTMRKK